MSKTIFDVMKYINVHAHLLLVAWGIFFVAGLISAAHYMFVNQRNLSVKALWEVVFPSQMLMTRSGRFDIFVYLVAKLIKPLVALGEAAIVIFISGCVSVAVRKVFGLTHTGEIGPFGLGVLTLIAWIAWDFSNFFAHFLLHRVPFLWELHKVHHSATFLSPFTAARLHPLEEKFSHFVAAFFTGLAFGLAGAWYAVTIDQCLLALAFANLVMAITFVDALRHSHFPVSFGRLEPIFVSPRMHHLHHSAKLEHWDRNLGYVLTLWDHLFGTYHPVADGESFAFGIGRGAAVDESYHSVYGGYVRPTVAMFDVLVGRRKPEPRPAEAPTSSPDAGVSAGA